MEVIHLEMAWPLKKLNLLQHQHLEVDAAHRPSKALAEAHSEAAALEEALGFGRGQSPEGRGLDSSHGAEPLGLAAVPMALGHSWALAALGMAMGSAAAAWGQQPAGTAVAAVAAEAAALVGAVAAVVAAAAVDTALVVAVVGAAAGAGGAVVAAAALGVGAGALLLAPTIC